MESHTYRLFKYTPSFLSGLGSILDLSKEDKRYVFTSTPEAADCEAIQADWMAIGSDMHSAIIHYDQENQASETELAPTN